MRLKAELRVSERIYMAFKEISGGFRGGLKAVGEILETNRGVS